MVQGQGARPLAEGARVGRHVDGVLLQDSSGTMSSARSCVEASTTNAAAPSSWARSQLTAVTHQRSPGTSPGKPYGGIGVDRSLPIERWCSRNSAVTTAQIVWLPRSSGPVLQQPSR